MTQEGASGGAPSPGRGVRRRGWGADALPVPPPSVPGAQGMGRAPGHDGPLPRGGPGEVAITCTRDELRWQRLVHDSPLGVAIVSFDGHIVEANDVLLRLLDRPAEQVLGALFHSFASPVDATRLDREALLRTGTASMTKRYLRGDGEDLWLRVTANLVHEGGERRTLSLCEDVTEARRASALLAHRADHDPLTGLPNREQLGRRVRRLLAEVARGASDGVALLFLDLDRFKVINDSLGHAAGDRLLREVAQRLQALTPPGDLLARLGGDEFALATRDADGAYALAGQLVDALQTPFGVEGREVTVGASVGLALRRRCRPGTALAPSPRPGEGDEPDDEHALLRDADTAMYAAKRAGEGPVVVFEEGLRRRALARLEDEQGLRRALQRGELRVHYQPILRLSDLRVQGYEALVRWEHPERGLLPPSAFLPTAEETGLVVPLGRVVLDEACARVAVLRASGQDVRMSVNVAAQHLAAGTLTDDVDAALGRAGLPPQALTLEITEQALVVGRARASAELAALRERGCRVALDDFGTGYSSLAYLRWLPVDILKIDRTFVAGAGADEGYTATDLELLTAIAAIGRSLGLQTVLEGIETPAELEAARQAGATQVQGFLVGRPEPGPSEPS